MLTFLVISTSYPSNNFSLFQDLKALSFPLSCSFFVSMPLHTLLWGKSLFHTFRPSKLIHSLRSLRFNSHKIQNTKIHVPGGKNLPKYLFPQSVFQISFTYFYYSSFIIIIYVVKLIICIFTVVCIYVHYFYKSSEIARFCKLSRSHYMSETASKLLLLPVTFSVNGNTQWLS